MLGFFRRHQRIFFMFVAVIVIVTMTFFGGYYSFRAPTRGEDPVVFTAIDGTSFTRREMAQMVLFLGSDSDDKLQSGGVWGPNFLNDGVIRHDLLHSGLALMLAGEYFDALLPDLRLRQDRERNYTPYVHAHARFLNAETVWNLYAPRLVKSYKQLREKGGELSPASFHNRVALYLEEQRFPQIALKQVLRYQESQYSWIPQDPYLFGQDLSLFGYHSLEDWFGPRFLTLAAEFLINASIVAQKQGYSVSAQEAWAELRRHGEQSFQANRQSPYLDVGHADEYIDRQLFGMGMDRPTATRIWQRVMLSRRLLRDVGNAPLVDLYSFRKFNEYADQGADLDIYTLAEGLHLPNYQALQAFECYLDAVSQREAGDLLQLPTSFRSVSEVKERAPELVQRRYLLRVQQLNDGILALRIPVRDLWNFQLAEENWPAVIDKFPILASKKAGDRHQRLQAIDALDRQTRHHLDVWTQSRILAAHPEWIDEAFADIESEEVELWIGSEGMRPSLGTLTDAKKLSASLESVALEAPDKAPLLSRYTEDEKNYYRIEVVGRSENEEILTFVDAQQSGAIEATVQRRLGDRGKARDSKADKEFSEVLQAVYRTAIVQEPFDSDLPEQATGSYAAKHRFRAYLERARSDILANGDQSPWIYREQGCSAAASTLSPRPPLGDQWKLERKLVTVHRHAEQPYGSEELYEMPIGSWSPVVEEGDKSAYFFCVVDRTPGQLLDSTPLDRSRLALAEEAQRCYMSQLLQTMRDQQALSLARVFPEETH